MPRCRWYTYQLATIFEEKWHSNEIDYLSWYFRFLFSVPRLHLFVPERPETQNRFVIQNVASTSEQNKNPIKEMHFTFVCLYVCLSHCAVLRVIYCSIVRPIPSTTTAEKQNEKYAVGIRCIMKMKCKSKWNRANQMERQMEQPNRFWICRATIYWMNFMQNGKRPSECHGHQYQFTSTANGWQAFVVGKN